MDRLHSFVRMRGGVSPGRRRALRLGAAAAVSLCVLTAIGLVAPGLVLCAEGEGDRAGEIARSADPAAQSQTGVGAASVGAAPIASVSRGTLIVKLPWGSGPGQVGLLAPAEGLARGPEAVAVDATGRIAVLDSVNNRLVLLDAAGAHLRTITLNLKEPRFLAVTTDALYVMDCDTDRLLAAYDWQGVEVSVEALPVFDDVVTGLFATDAGPCVEIAHDQTLLVTVSATLSAAGADTADRTRPAVARARRVSGRPVDARFGRTAGVSFKPGSGLRVKLFQVDEQTLGATQRADFAPAVGKGRTIEHLVSVDGDGRGGLIVGARMATTDTTVRAKTGGATQPALVLTRLGWTGTDVGTSKTSGIDAVASPAGTVSTGSVGSPSTTGELYLNDCPFAYLGQPYTVAPDGRVIQPVADETGYSLFAHAFAGTTVETAEVAQ